MPCSRTKKWTYDCVHQKGICSHVCIVGWEKREFLARIRDFKLDDMALDWVVLDVGGEASVLHSSATPNADPSCCIVFFLPFHSACLSQRKLSSKPSSSADPILYDGMTLLSIGGFTSLSILGSPLDGSDPTTETTSRTRALFSWKRVHHHKRIFSGTSSRLDVELDIGTKVQRVEDVTVQAPLEPVGCN